MAPVSSCLLLATLLMGVAGVALADRVTGMGPNAQYGLHEIYDPDNVLSSGASPFGITQGSGCKTTFSPDRHTSFCNVPCKLAASLGCNDECTFDAAGDCACIGGVCGDPHFIGGQGVAYDFHGWPDHEYAIISDQDFHLSAHMIGQEFVETGLMGTWMSRLGFMYNFDGQTNRVELALKEVDSTVTDTLVLLVNGLVMDLPTEAYVNTDTGLTLSAWNPETKSLVITVASFLTAEVSVAEHKFPDGFHLDFTLVNLKTTSSVHGVLGQTFSLDRAYLLASLVADVKAGSKASYDEADVVEGVEGDYEISGLFATDFAYNRFGSTASGLSLRKLLGSSPLTEVPYVIRFDAGVLKIVRA